MSRCNWQTSWRWTEEEGAAAVEEWKRSGLGAAAFARQNGVTAWRLYWWKRRLTQKALEVAHPRLVPAEILGVPSARVNVRVPPSTVVEIDGADPEWVAELVRALGRLS